jgi:hypothetical protein
VCLPRQGAVAYLFLVRSLAHFDNPPHVKTRTVITLLSIVSFVLPALGQNPQRRRQAPQNQQANGPQPPSAVLSRFTANQLDRILSPIDRQIPLPRTRLSQIRAQFTDKLAQAPDTEKTQYQAAVAVCDALNAAMDEREKAIASLQGSAAVHAPSDLGARRRDLPTRGGVGTAMLADAELRSEAREERNRKQEARQNDNFFDTQLKTNWTQRTLQIRQNIQLLMSRQRDAERVATPPQAAPPAPAASPATTP